MWARAIAGVLVALAFSAAPAGAALDPPTFGPAVKLPDANAGTEPRIVIAPNGTRYVITNAGSGGDAVVYASPDGKTWHRTATIPGQQSATIDTEVAISSSGRLVATELDAAGLNFVTAYSDDGGATWTQSSGATTADQDRPWLAAGPGNRMYLLFHNLATGVAQHEMFVATSKDGGATFDPPVPIAMPGEQAYLDLQCADSGAPSALVVGKGGRIYAVYGTRTSPAGGCGASITGTPEANVVGETRVWVATSPDGSVGSWENHLAADAGDKTVSASFEPAAVDRAGDVYVAYAETAHTYPDFSGAAIKYVSAGPDAKTWSQPRVVAPAGAVGHYDPSIVAGDAGELALAYYEGVPRGTGADPAWFVRSARVSGARSGSPQIVASQVSGIPAYAQSPNAMGGSCASGPLAGLENGLTCDRATDDWGIALDAQCLLTITFPTIKNDAPGSDPGTFVSTQTGGSRACGAAPANPALPVPSGTPPGTTEVGPPKLRRRLLIGHLGGRAAALAKRWKRLGYVYFGAKVSRGSASDGRGFLYRRVRGKLRLVARSRKGVALGTKAKTLHMPFVPGAPKVVRGSYLSVVTAKIAGERVTRARSLKLR
ncbi:MAG: repeat-like domain [Thermoleophilaceae bacterium]|nr:repeat-like domain [Thermoleophilaceae bacterium]